MLRRNSVFAHVGGRLLQRPFSSDAGRFGGVRLAKENQTFAQRVFEVWIVPATASSVLILKASHRATRSAVVHTLPFPLPVLAAPDCLAVRPGTAAAGPAVGAAWASTALAAAEGPLTRGPLAAAAVPAPVVAWQVAVDAPPAPPARREGPAGEPVAAVAVAVGADTAPADASSGPGPSTSRTGKGTDPRSKADARTATLAVSIRSSRSTGTWPGAAPGLELRLRDTTRPIASASRSRSTRLRATLLAAISTLSQCSRKSAG